jgi:hypothetical protein
MVGPFPLFNLGMFIVVIPLVRLTAWSSMLAPPRRARKYHPFTGL